jgi:hypothetical protein
MWKLCLPKGRDPLVEKIPKQTSLWTNIFLLPNTHTTFDKWTRFDHWKMESNENQFISLFKNIHPPSTKEITITKSWRIFLVMGKACMLNLEISSNVTLLTPRVLYFPSYKAILCCRIDNGYHLFCDDHNCCFFLCFWSWFHLLHLNCGHSLFLCS